MHSSSPYHNLLSSALVAAATRSSPQPTSFAMTAATANKPGGGQRPDVNKTWKCTNCHEKFPVRRLLRMHRQTCAFKHGTTNLSSHLTISNLNSTPPPPPQPTDMFNHLAPPSIAVADNDAVMRDGNTYPDSVSTLIDNARPNPSSSHDNIDQGQNVWSSSLLTKRDWPCKTCLQKFRSRASLREHRSLAHSAEQRRRYVSSSSSSGFNWSCSDCSIRFPSRRSLRTHRRTVHKQARLQYDNNLPPLLVGRQHESQAEHLRLLLHPPSPPSPPSLVNCQRSESPLSLVVAQHRSNLPASSFHVPTGLASTSTSNSDSSTLSTTLSPPSTCLVATSTSAVSQPMLDSDSDDDDAQFYAVSLPGATGVWIDSPATLAADNGSTKC